MYQTDPSVSVKQQSSFLSFLMVRSTAVSIFIGCLIVAAWFSNHSVGAAAQKPRPTVEQTVTLPKPPPVPSVNAADAQAYEQDKQAQVEVIAKREQARLKRAEAGSKMEESRQFYQFFFQDQWNQIIYTNLPSFDAARLQAVESHVDYIPCTVCHAHSKLEFCILCGNTGKCPKCNGTGDLSSDQTCPTCMGTGQCFLCAGSGKMTCPFCDDGEISAHHKDPSSVIPIH